MTTGGAVDQLYIEITARMDGFERSLRELEREAGRTGEQAGSRLTGAFKGALGIATVAAGAAAVGGALALAARPLTEMASEYDRARASAEMFNKTLERTNTPAKEAQAAVAELSDKLKVAPQVLQEGITLILRAGGSLEDATQGLLAAGASAAASGADIGKAVENAAVGLAMGRSEMMEYAGIVVNASDAHKAYAKQLGISVEAMTEAQKIAAYSKAVYEESKYEVEDLGVAMSGLAGQQAQAAMNTAEFRQALGEAFLPILKEFNSLMGTGQGALLDFVKNLDVEAIAAFASQMGDAAAALRDGFGEAINSVRDFLGQLNSSVANSDTAEAFKSNFAILKSAAAEVFGAVSNLVQNVFIPSIQAMAPVAQGMWAGIQPVFSAIAPLVKSVAGVVSAAVNLIVQAFQHIAPVVRPLLPIIGGAFNGMGHVIAIAVRAITTTLNALAALLRGDLPAAARIMQNLISKAIHSAADVFRVFGSLATRALSGVAARMGTVGRQIVQGLINGIKAGIGGVIATMRRLASSAVNAAKNALVIRSPSRVMFGVGQYTAEGFVKGIDDKKPAVARAARNSAKLYVNETLKELAEGRKRIREAIKDAQLASDIKNATDKQLASALKRAYDAGDFEKWNAVLLEQKRRAEAVKTALERVAEAQQNIREGEAFDAWKESLEGYSDAQLEAARSAEFAAGETQRYNAVIAEQKRRAEEAAEALEKLRSVQQDMRAEVLSEAKGVILNDLLDFDALKDIREQAYKSGDKALWKAAREAMQENGREAARGYIDSMEAVLSSGGSYPEAWATLQKGLNDLRGQRAQGFDVSEGISMLYQQVEKLQAGLRELDPALRRAVRSGEVLFQADKPADQILGQKLEIPLKNRWDEFLKKLANDRALKDYEKRLRAEFSNADLAAELDRIAASSLNAEEKIERYNVVLDVQADRAKQAEEAAKVLVAMQREVSAAVADSERPFAKQLQQLEELRLAVSDSETLRQIDGLIAAYRKMQAEAEQRDALKAKINKWSGYAQQLVPLVSAAFEAIGGMSQEAAAQWGQALDSMVSDLTNFGMALAKGDYFAAAVQGLTTIFGWFNRNKRAAAEAAKAAADYNAQFRFSQNGYGTRSVSSYSTGILFWKTTHYTESIDEAKKQLALNLESGFIDGIREGFKTALEQNDFGAFQQKLKESVGEAVINGLIDAFMKKAVLGDIIGPAIQGYLDTGNAGLLETAIQGATAISEQLFHDLRGIRERLGLGSANAAGGLNQMGDLFGNAPSIQLGIPRIEVAMPPILTESLNAFGASVPVFDRASHRMLEAAELILSTRNAGGPPPLSRRGPLV